jgi:phospholipid/cholesterol/gamma-HCH transport system substrate-binding protein
MSTEVKVGMLFLVGVGLSVWFTFQTTKISKTKGEFHVDFRRIARLAPGDAVTYNGVKVGTVAQVAPVLDEQGQPRVRVNFAIEGAKRNAVLLNDGSSFRIQQGLLGGASLEIVSQGGEPIEADTLGSRLGDDPANIDESLVALRQLIDENRVGINQTITSAKSALDAFSKASAEAQTLLAENRADVRAAIASVRQTTERLPGLVDRLLAAATELRETVAENRDQLRRATTAWADLMPQIAAIAADVKKVSGQISSGQGTIGRLVMEDTLHAQAVATLDNANQRIEEIKPLTEGFSQVKIALGVEGGWNATTGGSRAGAYLRLEPRPWKFYEGGASYRFARTDIPIRDDDPDELGLDFNLLLGWRWLPNDAVQRYRVSTAVGVIESQIGARVDIPLADRWDVRLIGRWKHTARDSDDRRAEHGNVLLRPSLVWRPWSRLWIEAGVDDASDDPAPWLGARFEMHDNDLRNFAGAAALSR